VLYTMEQRRDQEAITCYDADKGTQYWAFTYPALFDDRQGDKGPRATPTVADGEVFAFGATGMLTCLDARTGAVKWGPVNVLAGNSNVSWGLSGSPLVTADLVLVNAGKQTPDAPHGTLVAFDRKTGAVKWSTGSAAAGYSSPQLSTVAGKQQVLLFDAGGIAGYDLADKGKELWRFDWAPSLGISVAQSLVIDENKVFVAASYNAGSVMLRVTQTGGTWKVEQLWRTNRMRCKFTSPVYYQGHIYGLDEGTLTCLDAATGQQKWRGKAYDHGQILLAKDLIVVQSEWGLVALVEANPSAFRELGSFQALDQRRSWNPFALADGRLYVRNNVQMACYDLAGQ